ncbi:hypothetical protein ACFQ0Q_28330 [Streptomyces aureus]
MDDLLQRVRRLAGPEAAPDPALLAELARSQDVTLVREAGRHLAALDPRLVTPPGRTPRPCASPSSPRSRPTTCCRCCVSACSPPASPPRSISRHPTSS